MRNHFILLARRTGFHSCCIRLVEKQDSTKELSDKFCFWQTQLSAQMRDEFLEGFGTGLYDIIFNGVPLCAG